MSWPSRRSSKRCTPKLQSRISLKPIKIQARATPGRNGGIRTCRPTRVPRHGIDFAVSRHGHCRKASLPNRGARSDGSLRPPATRLRASCARAMSTDTPLTDEQKANADEAYYRELLQRVDSTIAQTSKVTSNNAYANLNGQQEPLWMRVLREHSILGIYCHVDVQNNFTKTLKLFFFLISLLWAIFFSMRLTTASEFGDWVLMVLLLHLIHWGQRALFFRFQTSLFLWPFAAGVELTALVFADLVELGKGGSWAWRRVFSLGASAYVIGFMGLEALVRWYRAKRTSLAGGGGEEGTQHLEDALTGDTEDYSTL